jgi:hypothetical protein
MRTPERRPVNLFSSFATFQIRIDFVKGYGKSAFLELSQQKGGVSNVANKSKIECSSVRDVFFCPGS